MNWSTVYALLNNKIGATKEELEQEITEKIGLTNQFLDELPEAGESGVLYFIPKDDVDPSAEDQYFMYVWDPDNTEFVLLDPDMDMSIYAKTADLATVATSGLYSDLSGTPDLTPYITENEADDRYMSIDAAKDKIVTGNPVTLETLDKTYLKSAKVTFEPKQDLHGYDAPWAGGNGKNKLPPKDSTTTANNITYTPNADESITVTAQSITGTATRVYGAIYGVNSDNPDLCKPLPNGLTAGGSLFMKIEGNPEGMELVCQFQNSDGSIIEAKSTQNTLSTTIPSNASFVYISLMINKNTISLPINSTVKCFVGSEQVTAWQPYENICPISGWDGLNLTRSGKNLFNKSAITDESWLSTTTGETETSSSTTNYVVSDFIPVLANQPVYIPASGSARRWFYDLNKNPVTYLNNSGNQAYTPTNSGYIRITINKTLISLDTYQVEWGSTATDYEPYQGQTHTATFPDTVYGGSYDFVSGDGTELWVAVDMGDIDYTYSNNMFRFRPTDGIISGDVGANADDFMCSIYQRQSDKVIGVQSLENLKCAKTSSATYCSYYFRNDNYTTVEDFKTAMAGQTFAYKLATPTPIELTAQDILLNAGTNVVSTDADTAAITYTEMTTLDDMRTLINAAVGAALNTEY